MALPNFVRCQLGKFLRVKVELNHTKAVLTWRLSIHSINLRALEADAYEVRSRIGDAWDRLTADKPFDDYGREKTLEDVDRALALAFKLTDIFSEVVSELRRDRHPAPKKPQAA